MIDRRHHLLSVLLALGVFGCGRADEDSAVVLRVANWGSPAVESSFMALERDLRAEFEAQHPGVHVQVELIPGEGRYAPKLMMMHVADSMPDVIHLDASSAAVFVDNGVLRDLTPMIAGDATFELAAYFDNVTDIARRGDALYAIPLDFTPMVIYYNKTLFDRAGVPYPHDGWTWAEFLETSLALTVISEKAARPRQYGFNFINWMPGWLPWLWANGGDVLDETGSRATGYLDGPETVEAVQFLVDLIRKHHAAPGPAETAALGIDLFRAGRAAMDLKGHWMMLDYRADGIDFGVVSLPTNTGRPVTVIYESGLAITENTRHPELAWQYIKFMTGADVQRRRVASGLAISAHRQVAAIYAGNPIEDSFLRQVPAARAPWGARVERYPFVEELGREMMEDILYGTVTVEESLHQTALLIDRALGEP
ncbi:MAG: sugar ABC transporter substrate-binding protein [Planctomycetes bacterium]|nr:sugar ABC transporter substrate-binding protein [Planctomycetota bacterium]